MHRAFVYGTLKTGLPNHYLLKDEACGKCVLLCKAKTTKKYPLVVATPYNVPFLLGEEGTGNFIEGEVYEVDDNMLKTLDKLESHPTLYRRTPMEVLKLDDSSSVMQCEAYVLFDYNPELLNLTFLTSYQNLEKYMPPDKRPQAEVIKYVKNVK